MTEQGLEQDRRQNELDDQAKQARDRLDALLTGIAIGAAAYIGSRYPSSHGAALVVEGVALGAIALGAIAGLWRAEQIVQIRGLEAVPQTALFDDVWRQPWKRAVLGRKARAYLTVAGMLLWVVSRFLAAFPETS